MRRRRRQIKPPLPTIPLYGDSIFQLKDGRILAYHMRKGDNLIVYDQNSFKELFNINLSKIIIDEKIEFKYNKEKMKNKFKDDFCYLNENEEEKEKKIRRYYINELMSKTKISIIQQINGNLLISYSQFIFDINIYENSFDYKIFQKEDEENILSINELSENKIIK